MIHPTCGQLIRDVDKPLIISQLIDSPVNCYKDVNQSKNAKIKVILIMTFTFMCVIRFNILLLFHSKSPITNYFNDITILFGNTSFYFYIILIAIIMLFEICLIYHMFYFSPENDMKWFAILSIFKGK